MLSKINPEKRLYVISLSSGGYSTLSFDECFQNACQMAQLMGRKIPGVFLIGTQACYDLYEELTLAFATHRASKRTWFDPGTDAAVQRILNQSMELRRYGAILRLFYGDPDSGRDWCEENDVVGFIGRSNGTRKVPLLLEPLQGSSGIVAAEGGPPILTRHIVRIIDVLGGSELYRTRNYQLPMLTIGQGSDKKLPVSVFREGVNEANFANFEQAAQYVAYIQGFRPAMPYRTYAAYIKEMRQAA